MASTEQITTAERLLHAPDLGRCELVAGELIMMSPAGFEHGRIVCRIALCLGAFVDQHELGVIVAGDTGFVLAHNPDTVRAPDVAFISRDRYQHSPVTCFFEGPPDLAVEVLSPSDRAGELLAKVQEWLAAGCQAVWVADPEKKTVAVYDNHGAVAAFKSGDQFGGGELLPGFTVAVDDLFARR